MKFTIEEVRKYVEGWLGSESDLNNLTLNEIGAMLANASAMLRDDQDGIYGVRYDKLSREIDDLGEFINDDYGSTFDQLGEEKTKELEKKLRDLCEQRQSLVKEWLEVKN